MPTYEYSCDSCGNDFEVFQKMSDEPVQVCPKCGQHVRRVLSGGIGICFKGSGFYVNDSHASARPESCPASAGGEGSCCSGCRHSASGN
ncbi:MAG: FmdB family transcriptional regulator [Spirochaetes bacterium]|uniref:FmdB family transcriptional regulator n=1 Tax=Candidatus Avitreponema avistercoris TaxID=2840705 RepID=A0A9D9HG88_9SPIR|nr:FmdB family transcriptional regulator [Candidatus Avitreponema avistercoris]